MTSDDIKAMVEWLGWPDCSGCTDPRSEGTHQSGTRQHPAQEEVVIWHMCERLEREGWRFEWDGSWAKRHDGLGWLVEHETDDPWLGKREAIEETFATKSAAVLAAFRKETGVEK